MKTSIIKIIALGLAMTFSMGVQGQVVISQLLTGTTVSAIEIYNHSSTNQVTLTSTNFEVEISVDNKSQNIVTWSPSTNVVLEPRGNVVIIGNGSQKTSFITYLESKGASYLDASSTLSFLDADAFQINYAASGTPTTLDRVGNWLSSQSKPTGNGGPSIDDINYERDLEFTESGDPTFNRPFLASTPGGTYQQISLVSATNGYNEDDFEGFGLSPGNIKFDGTNWSTPSNANSASSPASSSNFVIEVTDEVNTSIVGHKIKELIIPDGATVTLSADASGYSQAKKIKMRGVNNSGVIRQERYFANEGWHVIGSPFAENFANSSFTGTRGSSPLSWYWAPDGNGTISWSQGNAPVGLGMMVYVGAGKSYSYLNQGGKLTVQGTPQESFAWDMDANQSPDAPLYYLSDGHTGVGSTGINLLSNPFSCAIDWDLIWPTTTNISPEVLVWDPTLPGWISYNASTQAGDLLNGEIPPMAAFDVFVTNASAARIAVNIDDVANASSSAVYNKTGNSNVPNLIEVGISASKDVTGYTNKIWIANRADGTLGYDSQYDSWKVINSGNGHPAIYIEGPQDKMSSNSVDLSQPQSIEIGVSELSKSQSYSISLNQRIIDGNDYDVTLEDTYTNSMVDLTVGSYTFTNPNEDLDEDRFILHVNQNTVSLNEFEGKSFFAYAQNDDLYINVGNLDVLEASLFTMDGKEIITVPITESIQKITSAYNNASMVYLLKITFSNGESSYQKVLF